jgi:hypothetical protein
MTYFITTNLLLPNSSRRICYFLYKCATNSPKTLLLLMSPMSAAGRRKKEEEILNNVH